MNDYERNMRRWDRARALLVAWMGVIVVVEMWLSVHHTGWLMTFYVALTAALFGNALGQEIRLRRTQ